MRKATVKKMYVGKTYGDLGRIINLRQAIERGDRQHGVGYYFVEIDKDELDKYLEEDKDIMCVKTLSGKYREINKSNVNSFIF